ncbi:pyridoxine/pyridoxamine 5'-phosphate oxidase [Dietzia sp.]|uniref:pyridoxine/pyridoxamine 5'-phosphate oxidase n=1 Tax=Dietzia sp. TaxID=1871616 RepID=UPI002FD9AECE
MATTPSAVPDDFRGLRETYGHNRLLDPADLGEGWWSLLSAWIADAATAGAREPNAMVLATSAVIYGGEERRAGGERQAGGGAPIAYARPSTRTVLCKGITPGGVRFFTTRTSRKGRQLAANPFASATFPLLERERQVHVEGAVVELPDAESRAYWATRGRASQLAAWASSQSEPVANAEALGELYASAEARFPDGGGAENSPDSEDAGVPMPPYWGGYELRPDRVEFWQGGAGRFHDRLVAEMSPAAGGEWEVRRLQP